MSATIAILSQPHVRRTEPKKRAQLAPEQRKERTKARDTKQAEIDAAIGQWYADSLQLAEKLAETHKKKPKYFLEMMFQGGAKMVYQQNKQNPYNTFTAEKAAECCDRGESKNAAALHAEFDDEYYKLTEDDFVKRFQERHEKEVTLRCSTPHAKIQDVANISRNIKFLLAGLSMRVGVEGFFCIVRNSPDFSMQPQWFFTSRELEAYMPLATRRRWVTSEVRTKMEAFAVAGCNILSTCHLLCFISSLLLILG
ncbi:hypothetical protein DFH07DRAFT_726892 [Mycena maculata]|uniref:Uncharacterized protein n=1 Tax=Mycena maculata TaxID=230809 RepID=A0AAD7KDX3_9AGAR|nr:hypothetical protein DFH07DRAFT_726892 [Mycena maculata]